MKLTIAWMTLGLVLVSWTSNVSAGGFSAEQSDHQESERDLPELRSPIDSDAVDLVPHLTVGNCQFESDCHRVVASQNRQKAPTDRVDLFIKRSHRGIQVTISHQPEDISGSVHQNSIPTGKSQFHARSRVCSYVRNSYERKSLELSDPSVTGDFDRSKRNELFNVRFTHVPGPTSLAISILDLIGVVIGFYSQRRSNVV